MNKTLLAMIFGIVLVVMLAFTVRATLDRSVLEVGPDILNDVWFQATLVDAYLGFLTFYVWVAYKEKGILGRLLWLVAIMLLGNIAMAIYILWQVGRWDESSGAAGLLLRERSAVSSG